MSTSQTPDAATTVPSLVAPAGLNLLGDQDAGMCCGGSCALPAQ